MDRQGPHLARRLARIFDHWELNRVQRAQVLGTPLAKVDDMLDGARLLRDEAIERPFRLVEP